jgi:predicted GNAT family acetyltransferase
MDQDVTKRVAADGQSGRYELEVDGHVGFAEYELDGGRIIFPHTVVPREIGGRGVAARLVKAALADAKAQGLTVVPACSYVAAYVRRHPDEVG